MRRANCPVAAAAEAAAAEAAIVAVQSSAAASEAVKRAMLAQAGVRLLESPAACGRLIDALLLLDDGLEAEDDEVCGGDGRGPPLLSVSLRRGGPPRHPPVLLAVAVSREGASASAAAAATTYLIDLIRQPQVLGRGGLARLFQSAEITKVFHYGVEDAVQLSDAFALGRWRRVCDVGLGFESLLARSGLPRRRVSLRALLQMTSAAAGSPAAALALVEEDSAGHAYWQRRPLTLDMATEAAAAVRAALTVYGIGCRLGAAWGPPMADLDACRREANRRGDSTAKARKKPAGTTTEQQPEEAALPLLLQLMAAECGGAAAVAADCQPVARKLPFGILK